MFCLLLWACFAKNNFSYHDPGEGKCDFRVICLGSYTAEKMKRRNLEEYVEGLESDTHTSYRCGTLYVCDDRLQVEFDDSKHDTSSHCVAYYKNVASYGWGGNIFAFGERVGGKEVCHVFQEAKESHGKSMKRFTMPLFKAVIYALNIRIPKCLTPKNGTFILTTPRCT